MKRKRIILLALLLLMSISTISFAEDEDIEDIKVFVKGDILKEDSILKNGRTFVPLRLVSEKLDFYLDYRAQDKTVLIKKDEREIIFSIGSKKVYVDGKEEILDSEVFLNDSKTFVPLRFISESLYENVIWDEKNKIAIVGSYSEAMDKKDTYLYYNKDFQYSISLPNSWKEDVVIEEKVDSLDIYDRASLERFKEDGDTCGPTIEIRVSDYPIISEFPYEKDKLLSYNKGQYIEAIFDRDFQYYKDTEKTYRKIQNEGAKILKSFEKVEDKDSFVEDNIEGFHKERLVLESVVENYVPKNIFDINKVRGYRFPMRDDSLLYLSRENQDGSVSIKLESEFDKEGKLARYHFKNYDYKIRKGAKQISQDEGLRLANEFVRDYVGRDLKLIKIPDLYPSLYKEGVVESYGDLDGRYMVLVDLENGFVEFFTVR